MNHPKGIRVASVVWQSKDIPDPDLPTKQNLERLVCCAYREVYPDRYNAVRSWLDSRPDGTGISGKPEAWSCYAGWFANHGPGDFFRCVWDDEKLADALEGRLRDTGALATLQSLVNP